MEYGIQLATSAHHWKIVKRAEAMGFTHAWFYDTHLLNAEVFVAMGAAAVQTSKIKLCTGVLIPSNRIAPVAASALASLNALAPGRIVMGLGTGFTGRRTMGLPAITLARLEEYLRVVQALLRGETTEWSEEGGTHKVRFLNPEKGYININDSIPAHISAFGPKGRALVAKLGTGWLSGGGKPQQSAAALEAMRKAWQEAGRNTKDLYATTFCGGAVLQPGEAADSPRAKAQVGPHATLRLHNAIEAEAGGFRRPPLPAQFQPLLERFREVHLAYQPADARYLTNHRGHLMFLRPEEEPLCTAELIRAMTFTATKTELRERLRALKRAGLSHFSINIRLGHPEMLEEWAELFAGV